MKLPEIYENLCFYDKRNDCLQHDEDTPPARSKGCACDTCFYGKDELAMEILKLREALQDTNDRLFNYWYCDDTGRTPKGTIDAIERNKTLLNN